jgi:hypothetical protein
MRGDLAPSGAATDRDDSDTMAGSRRRSDDRRGLSAKLLPTVEIF